MTIPCSARDGLNFSASSGERQKHISALTGALATGCKAPGLYGKKPLLFIIYFFLEILAQYFSEGGRGGFHSVDVFTQQVLFIFNFKPLD
jgi:hypothetical protein